MTDFFVNAVSNSSNKKHQPNQAFAELELDNCHHVQFKIDTGAQVNIIPKSVYESLSPLPKLMKTEERLTGYSGKKLDVLGYINIRCVYKERKAETESCFYIVDTPSPPIAGLPLCLNLQLVQLILC